MFKKSGKKWRSFSYHWSTYLRKLVRVNGLWKTTLIKSFACKPQRSFKGRRVTNQCPLTFGGLNRDVKSTFCARNAVAISLKEQSPYISHRWLVFWYETSRYSLRHGFARLPSYNVFCIFRPGYLVSEFIHHIQRCLDWVEHHPKIWKSGGAYLRTQI